MVRIGTVVAQFLLNHLGVDGQENTSKRRVFSVLPLITEKKEQL